MPKVYLSTKIARIPLLYTLKKFPLAISMGLFEPLYHSHHVCPYTSTNPLTMLKLCRESANEN